MEKIIFENVSKHYKMGRTIIKAIDGISFEIEMGKVIVILGASGSGKSTTLNMLGAMDRVTSGKIFCGDKEVTAMSEKEMEQYRRNHIGFVFQFYNLISSLTAKENVGVVGNLVENPMDVDQVIQAVGLEDRKDLFPSNLSGGELQRLSIARALVKRPTLMLCDEPTGALDSETGQMVLKLLVDTAVENNIALVIVTHNSAFSEIADRVIRLKDGKILENVENDVKKSVMEVVW